MANPEPDTWYSIPATVTVHGAPVSGYVTVATLSGLSTPSADDPAVLRFVRYRYGQSPDPFAELAHAEPLAAVAP